MDWTKILAQPGLEVYRSPDGRIYRLHLHGRTRLFKTETAKADLERYVRDRSFDFWVDLINSEEW